MKRTILTLLALAALAAAGCSKEETRPAETRPAETRPATVAADDTKKNQRDRSGDTLTPGDQGESEADRAITAQVRKDVVADSKLGMTAKNVKIITRNGAVTLRGPVGSAEERATVAGYAKRTPGVKSVDDQLEVASN